MDSSKYQPLANAAELALNFAEYQDTLYMFRETYTKQMEFHEETMDITRKTHEKNVDMLKRTYLMDAYVNLLQHFQQLNAGKVFYYDYCYSDSFSASLDLIASTRESERDMFDQCNQKNQTIILASSVMFSALATIMVQGYLSDKVNDDIISVYAITSSVSFLFLYLAIVNSVELTARASRFMYKRAKYQTKQLEDAILNSKEMIRDIKGSGRTRSRRNLLDEKGNIDEEWKKHEQLVYDFILQRDDLHRLAAAIDLIHEDKDQNRMSFGDFWRLHCLKYANYATAYFYLGTANLLFATMIFIYCLNFYNFNDEASASLGVSIITVSLVVGVVLLIYFNFYSPYTKLETRVKPSISLTKLGNNSFDSIRNSFLSEDFRESIGVTNNQEIEKSDDSTSWKSDDQVINIVDGNEFLID
jgi:hypothetical protein